MLFDQASQQWLATVEEAAELIGVSYPATRRLIADHRLAAIKRDGRWQVLQSSIDNFKKHDDDKGRDDELWLSRALVAGLDPDERQRTARSLGMKFDDKVLDDTFPIIGDAQKRQENLVSAGAPFVPRLLTIPWDAAIGMRANIDSATSTTGGAFKFGRPGAFVELLRVKSAMVRAGATFITGLTGPVTFPKQTGTATASWVAENPGSDLGYSNLTTGTVALAFKTIQTATAVSRQALFSAASGNYDLEQIIRGDLAAVIGLAIDLGGVSGLGASNQPLGILTDTAVTTSTLGTNGGPLTGAFCAQVVRDVAVVGNGDTDSATARWLTNSEVERSARNIARTTAIGLPLLSGALLCDKPAVFSNQLPRNLTKGTSTTVCSGAIFGIFEHFLIGGFGAGIDVVVDPFSLKDQGMIGISLAMYVDCVNRQPTAFRKVLDITTP